MRPDERRREWLKAAVFICGIASIFCVHKVLPPLPENADTLLQQQRTASAKANEAACVIAQKAKDDMLAQGLKRQAENLNVAQVCDPGAVDKRGVVELILASIVAVALVAFIASMRFA